MSLMLTHPFAVGTAQSHNPRKDPPADTPYTGSALLSTYRTSRYFHGGIRRHFLRFGTYSSHYPFASFNVCMDPQQGKTLPRIERGKNPIQRQTQTDDTQQPNRQYHPHLPRQRRNRPG